MNAHDICKSNYKSVKEQISKLTSEIKIQFCYKFKDGGFEVQFIGNDDLYWNGNADCKWDAQYCALKRVLHDITGQIDLG